MKLTNSIAKAYIDHSLIEMQTKRQCQDYIINSNDTFKFMLRLLADLLGRNNHTANFHAKQR